MTSKGREKKLPFVIFPANEAALCVARKKKRGEGENGMRDRSEDGSIRRTTVMKKSRNKGATGTCILGVVYSR